MEAFIGQEVQRGTKSLYADTIAYVERILLTHVLRDTSGNQSQAAQILGITRGWLRKKIREHGISITDSVDLENDRNEAEDEAFPVAP
ncbi:MAG: hypothetical protein GXY83_28395 [Rhodopirellula sp.]|nr:hypothetical protein [Rhodopirellula sp.]